MLLAPVRVGLPPLPPSSHDSPIVPRVRDMRRAVLPAAAGRIRRSVVETFYWSIEKPHMKTVQGIAQALRLVKQDVTVPRLLS